MINLIELFLEKWRTQSQEIEEFEEKKIKELEKKLSKDQFTISDVKDKLSSDWSVFGPESENFVFFIFKNPSESLQLIIKFEKGFDQNAQGEPLFELDDSFNKYYIKEYNKIIDLNESTDDSPYSKKDYYRIISKYLS